MSQNKVNANEELVQCRHSYNRDYIYLFSEDSQGRLEKLINIADLTETLLDSKGEMKIENTISAKQMASLFLVFHEELKLILADLYEPGGIFSQDEIQRGLELVRGHRTVGTNDNKISDCSH